jgi:hypothetical protein
MTRIFKSMVGVGQLEERLIRNAPGFGVLAAGLCCFAPRFTKVTDLGGFTGLWSGREFFTTSVAGPFLMYCVPRGPFPAVTSAALVKRDGVNRVVSTIRVIRMTLLLERNIRVDHFIIELCLSLLRDSTATLSIPDGQGFVFSPEAES